MLVAGSEPHLGALWPKKPSRCEKLKVPASGATGLDGGLTLAVMACTSCRLLQPWIAIMACSSFSFQLLLAMVLPSALLVKGTLSICACA